jgi:hypothetical protein
MSWFVSDTELYNPYDYSAVIVDEEYHQTLAQYEYIENEQITFVEMQRKLYGGGEIQQTVSATLNLSVYNELESFRFTDLMTRKYVAIEERYERVILDEFLFAELGTMTFDEISTKKFGIVGQDKVIVTRLSDYTYNELRSVMYGDAQSKIYDIAGEKLYFQVLCNYTFHQLENFQYPEIQKKSYS